MGLQEILQRVTSTPGTCEGFAMHLQLLPSDTSTKACPLDWKWYMHLPFASQYSSHLYRLTMQKHFT